MQYFSFVGMGPKNGYEKLIYLFEKNEELIYESCFVQEPIYQKHADQIDEILLFFTPQSKERYYQDLKLVFKKVKLTPIDISEDISFENFVRILADYVRSNESIIVDVTHSFRQIPMRMLFALKYIEFLKNAKVEHLYYGKVVRDQNNNFCNGIICDSVQDYAYQSITECLSQFNNTLIIRSKDWDRLLEQDEKISRFLKAMTDFNEMVELCEFDSSITAIRNIVESSRSIEKESEKYVLILPLTSSIRRKFDPVYNAVQTKEKRKQMILILLEHQRYQNAVTFTDQFLREECVSAVLSSSKAFQKKDYCRKKHIKENTFTYGLSQCILDRSANEKFEDIIRSSENYPKVQSVIMRNKISLDEFFNEIRNHMNHGTRIQTDKKEHEKIESRIHRAIHQILAIIDQIYAEVKE